MQLPCFKYPRGIISKKSTTNSTFDHLKGFFFGGGGLVFSVSDGALGT